MKAALAWKEPGAQVMYQGDPVAAVAADTEERAIDAARLVACATKPLPHLATVEQAMAADAPEVFPGGNTRQGQTQTRPAISTPASSRPRTSSSRPTPRTSSRTSAWRRTAASASGTATSSPRGCRRKAVHGTTRSEFAQRSEDSAGNVRVHHAVHGRRVRQQVRARRAGLICAKLAKQAKLPVKLMLDRKEEHLDTGNRPSATAHIKAGVDADGMLTAFDGQSWGTGGAGAGANSRCPYIYSSRIGGARTRTSTSTPGSSARCARRVIRRDASSPKS